MFLLAGSLVVTAGCDGCDSIELSGLAEEPDGGSAATDGAPLPPDGGTLPTQDGGSSTDSGARDAAEVVPVERPRVWVDRDTFRTDEPITVHFAGVIPDAQNAVGISELGANASATVARRLIGLARDGSVDLGPIPIGSYVARLYLDGQQVPAATSDPFSVESVCPLGMERCNGACIDVQSDPMHCGGCGRSCDDGDLCNGSEQCSAAECAAGLAMDCDDGNPCTADACAPTGCVNLAAADGTSCLAPAICGDSGVCSAGACTSRDGVCDDGNPCTQDLCNTDGSCSFPSLPDGTACADLTVCNGAELCFSGGCARGLPPTCNDQNPCTVDSCDPVVGCGISRVPNGTPCADGNLCNGTETCVQGACLPGTGLDCDDGNPCTADACDPAGGCTHTAVNDGISCADADACNGAETCVAGLCTTGPVPNCDDGNPCSADTCDSVMGCRHSTLANGTACADGNLCNGDEICVAGACTPGPALDCDDRNKCTVESCDPSLGCVRSTRADGASCSDGVACNGDETCHVGVCEQGEPVPCDDDGDPCTADVCTPTGCAHNPRPDGYPCADHWVCNGAETCRSGHCTAGPPPTCDDNNACTTQVCDGNRNMCLYAPVEDGLPCEDGNPATTGDTCRGGVCAEGRSTHRVNTTVNGGDPDSGSEKPYLSSDGRFIAFQSKADNLAANDTNGYMDVFVADVETGVVERISVNARREQGNGHSLLASPVNGGQASAISGDGRYIAFRSYATNLVPDDTNGNSDVFVKDRRTGEIKRVSVASDGSQAEPPTATARWTPESALSGEPSISVDGRFVAFMSFASNLVPNDVNGYQDVFRHDLLTGQTELVSISSNDTQGNSESDMPAISGDGQCVAFRSLAGNLGDLRGDHNYQYDIYVRYMGGGTTLRITMGHDGVHEPDDVSYFPAISADCTHVSFVSWATNLVPEDTNDTLDAFVKDLGGGATMRVSTASNGEQGNIRTGGPTSINTNGRYVAFYSWATNLIPDDTNDYCTSTIIAGARNCIDIFVKDTWTGQTQRVNLDAANHEGLNNSQDPSLSGNGTAMAFGSYARNFDPDKGTNHQDIFFTLTMLPPSP